MTATVTKYDVVLFGIDLDGPDRIAAVEKLARLLKISREQAERLAQSQGSVIAKDLDVARADQVNDKLRSIGVRCNVRPSMGSTNLELVALEEPVTVISCPACSHKHQVKEGEQTPIMCEQCGVVFAKYDKVAQEKKERDQVRDVLLARHQREIEAREKEREEREERERRKRLEEEIRKGLGLPKMLSSRSRLMGSAVAVFLTGITIGVGGLMSYDAVIPENASTMQAGAMPSGSDGSRLQAIAQADATIDPGTLAQMEIGVLLDKISTAGADAGGAFLSDAQLPRASFTRAQARSADDLPETRAQDTKDFLQTRMEALQTDVEWDLFILDEIDHLLTEGETLQAAKLIDQIREPNRRFERGAQLVAQLWSTNRATEAKKLSTQLTLGATRLPNAVSKVDAFCTTARHLHAGGRVADGEKLLRKASSIAAAVVSPAEKAAVNSEIAALLSDFGQREKARKLFTESTNALGEIVDPAQRLWAIALVAPGFAKAGHRASALFLLEQVAEKVDSVHAPDQRDLLLSRVAEIANELTDTQLAMDTVDRIADPRIKDRTMYRVLTCAIASGRLAEAIDLVERLQDPVYKAPALGLLGLYQERQEPYRAIAEATSARALEALDLIDHPAEKSAMSGEIGRYAARAGNAVLADGYFGESKRLAESLSEVPSRDLALAVLATNESQALRFADARRQLSRIKDSALRTKVSTDLNHRQRVSSTP